LFDKPLSALTIQEPPEGVHFGFYLEVGTDGSEILSKGLRYMSIGGINYPPTAAHPDPGTDAPETVSVAMRNSGLVIPLKPLADTLIKQLSVPQDQFTTAEFGLQLVEGLPSVSFKLPSPV
jgi:hypothetical protein